MLLQKKMIVIMQHFLTSVFKVIKFVKLINQILYTTNINYDLVYEIKFTTKYV